MIRIVSSGRSLGRGLGIGFGVAIAAVTVQLVAADEIRRAAITTSLVGTWAQSADLCAANDKSNIVLAEAKFSGPDGSCNVETVVETAGVQGPNYSVRGRCGEPSSGGATVVNLIVRPQGGDRLLIGTSFEDLKPYQRCPAK